MQDYHYLFQNHLAMKLREGGDPKYMVLIARAYAEDDSDLRTYAFREWVSGEEFSCGRCNSRFRGTEKVESEWDDVICERCRKVGEGAA